MSRSDWFAAVEDQTGVTASWSGDEVTFDTDWDEDVRVIRRAAEDAGVLVTGLAIRPGLTTVRIRMED